MKNKFLLSAISAVALAMALNACQETSVKPTSSVVSQEVNKPVAFVGATSLTDCRSKRNVTSYPSSGKLNWVKDTLYCLCGDVRVGSGKTLNIAAGTVVRGETTSGASLTVTTGASINAIGLPNDPIIFTSTKTVGQRAPMDWGGLIICGNAQINQGTAPQNVEGFPPQNIPAGTDAPPTFGSTANTNNNENSGRLSYVRIEFGGIPLQGVANSEKNGLTLCAVGSGTTIDHVQTSLGGDDGFEWFGGTVNAKYLISHRNLDDDFDTDWGFSGNVQFGVVSRDPALADISKSNGFESDNDADGVAPGPQTSATFSNFTVIGPIQCELTGVDIADYNDGLHIRRNSGLKVYNTVITGWYRHQFFNDLTVLTAVAGYNHAVRTPVSIAATINGAIWTSGVANTSATAANCDPDDLEAGIYRLSGLQPEAWLLSGVDFTPYSDDPFIGYTSPILSSGTDASLLNGFFTANAHGEDFFKGARDDESDNGWNITSGWVNWQPETLAYPNDGQF